MAAYYPSDQFGDDESISSGSEGGGGGIHRPTGGSGVPYQYSDDSGGMPGMMAGVMNDGDVAMIGGATSPTFLGGQNVNLGGSGPDEIVDFDDPRIANLPRILLMGPRRAGKTSVQRVVFHKMSPHETLFRLEATQMLERAVVDHTPLCRFTIWDFPGDQYDYTNASNSPIPTPPPGGDDNYNPDGVGEENRNSPQPSTQAQSNQQQGGGGGYDDQIFSKATALIFVLDAQDEPYDHVLQSFTDTVTRAVRANPTIAVEVFVHKVDGELFLSDEAKYDCRRDVMQQVADELAESGLSHDAIPISYHLTSIYDHSVFEALSRVVQRLIPELPTLEHLLNVLVSTCSMEKAYLFDVASKLYISTDSSPVDMQSVELCSDMIDVVLDVSGIYGMGGIAGGGKKGKKQTSNAPAVVEDSKDDYDVEGGHQSTEGDDGHIDSSAADDAALAEDVPPFDSVAGEDDEILGKIVGQNTPSVGGDDDVNNDETAEDAGADATGSAYDSESSSTIHLSNGMVLYLKEVDTMLALVCLTRAENFRKKSLINYNIGCLKKALRELPQGNQQGGGETK